MSWVGETLHGLKKKLSSTSMPDALTMSYMCDIDTRNLKRVGLENKCWKAMYIHVYVYVFTIHQIISTCIYKYKYLSRDASDIRGGKDEIEKKLMKLSPSLLSKP